MSLILSQVTVTWTAVAGATMYSIAESTTSPSSGYSTIATGITGTTWTSSALAPGNYYFEVIARQGTNWLSPNSNPGEEATIVVACTQP